MTLMISIGTAGFVIPFERLREQRHPAGDRNRYAQAVQQFEAICTTEFLRSQLWSGASASWLYAHEVEDAERDLDWWPELADPKPLPSELRTAAVLDHLRNALAHGNIFTRGNPIELLVFLAKPRKDSRHYAMLAVSPADFRDFLQKWFSFLSGLRLPEGIMENSVV